MTTKRSPLNRSIATVGVGCSTLLLSGYTTGADAKTDVQSVSKHWQDLGIQVEEYQSGGANPSDGVPDKLRSEN